MLSKVLSQTPVFEKIKDFLSKNPKYRAYVVGGFVRDLLLAEQSKDIDIVVVSDTKTVEKLGTVFTEELTKFLNISNVVYFKNYGTANFHYDNIEIEIVGARRESYDRGSRKPIVEDGTLADDLKRRDFTFNAMAISLNPDDFGTLIDHFQGVKDLNNGIVQTPLDPDITFSDDPLRMLRAIRFASRFQSQIDIITYDAIKKNVNRLDIISPERIIEEVNKILLSKKPSHGFSKLQDTGLLKKFLPEVSALDENVKGHKNNFLHTIQVVDQVREVTDNIIILWSALLHDIGKAVTKRYGDNGWTFHDHEGVGSKMIDPILQRLKMPFHEWGPEIKSITKLHGRLKALTDENVGVTDSACRRIAFESGPFLDDLLLFVKCDITTSNLTKKKKYQDNYDLLQQRIVQIAEIDNIRNFKVPIDGNEIMKTFNIKQSDGAKELKKISFIKEDIKNAILDGQIPNEIEAARKFMMSIASKYFANETV